MDGASFRSNVVGAVAPGIPHAGIGTTREKRLSRLDLASIAAAADGGMERRIAVWVRPVRICAGIDQHRDGVAVVRAHPDELLQRRQPGGVQPFRIRAAREKRVDNIGLTEVRPEGGVKGRVSGAVLAVGVRACAEKRSDLPPISGPALKLEFGAG